MEAILFPLPAATGFLADVRPKRITGVRSASKETKSAGRSVHLAQVISK
jgi:hypothetical protein